MTLPEDFDGCARACRTTGVHTLTWGECGIAPESARPEPRVSIGRRFTALDGHQALAIASVPISEMAGRIERVLRTVHIRLGPNALSGGEYAAMALAVAADLAEEQPQTERNAR
ncbi:hypothetical protein ACIQGZ_17170 [Streptomyces sp. NPDC092296]|uniref:hypothetical protein n=1 Tax=Streptomyces sp. NPDC092296 TaxID=3366012 RepID=UPI0037F5DEAC